MDAQIASVGAARAGEDCVVWEAGRVGSRRVEQVPGRVARGAQAAAGTVSSRRCQVVHSPIQSM